MRVAADGHARGGAKVSAMVGAASSAAAVPAGEAAASARQDSPAPPSTTDETPAPVVDKASPLAAEDDVGADDTELNTSRDSCGSFAYRRCGADRRRPVRVRSSRFRDRAGDCCGTHRCSNAYHRRRHADHAGTNHHRGAQHDNHQHHDPRTSRDSARWQRHLDVVAHPEGRAASGPSSSETRRPTPSGGW